MQYRKRITAIVIGAGIAGTTLLSAAPAFAAGNPVNVSATVPSSVSLTGLTASVSFPSTGAGQTAAVSGAEAYTVSTNDPSGYALRVMSGADSFGDGNGHNIPDNPNWTVTEKGAASGYSFHPASTGNVVTAPSTASTDSFSEDWSLAIPAAATPGSYSNTITYMAIGN